jgi:hypothetical protein
MAYENYGVGVFGIYHNPGAPVAGSNEVQTLTFAGPLSGGTFTIAVDGISTAAITASTVAATMVTAINAQLDAKFGAAQVVATAGTYAAGAGTILLTFSGTNYARRVMSAVTVANNLTGTSPTVTVTRTTPGVAQTLRDVQPGSLMNDTTNKQLYQAGGTAGALTWAKVGGQV